MLEDLLQALLTCHAAVFQEELGGFEAKILVDLDAQPHFYKAQPVPYALCDKVKNELTQLMEEGIPEPVQFAEWAAPIVPVLKRDKLSVGICSDFKQTVNRAAKLIQYPIPKVEDFFSSLAGWKS